LAVIKDKDSPLMLLCMKHEPRVSQF